jgi:putative RecB family exonuclease
VTGTQALAQLRQERHLSASAINTFLRCPRQYEFRYIRKLDPAHRAGVMAFGGAVHAALARYYTSLMQQNPAPLFEVEAAFTDAWAREQASPIPLLLDEDESPEALEAKGLDLLRVFYDQAGLPHVTDVEAPFSAEINDPVTGEVLPARLVGVFDLVVADPDGRNRVIEHKTAARRWTEDKLNFDLQLSAYHYAAAQMGYGDVRLTVQVLLKTKRAAVELYHPTRTGADHNDLLATVAGVLKAIDIGVSYPVRDNWACKKGCPYAGPCLAG